MGALEPIPKNNRGWLYRNHHPKQTSGRWQLVSGLHMVEIRGSEDEMSFTKKSIPGHSQWSNLRVSELLQSWISALGLKARRKSIELSSLSILCGINSKLLNEASKPFTRHSCSMSHLSPNPTFTKCHKYKQLSLQSQPTVYSPALVLVPWNLCLLWFFFSDFSSWRMTIPKARFNVQPLPLPPLPGSVAETLSLSTYCIAI